MGVSGTGVKLNSVDFGSANFVSVRVVHAGGIASAAQQGIYDLNAQDTNASQTSIRSTFANAQNPLNDFGQDLKATINGIVATTNGKTARINTDFLDLETTLTTSAAQTLGAVGGSNHALTITGGGADFQLSGQVNIAGRVSIGIQAVNTALLGDKGNGFVNSLAAGQANNLVDGDTEQAQKIVSKAIEQISSLRGRLGAFQSNTVGSTIRSLGVSVENTTAAESAIRDADFAAETAGLTRSQILVNASTQVLGLANQAPQAVLQLLG